MTPELLEGPLVLFVSSRDAGLRPCIARGYGCRIRGERATILVRCSAGREVVAAVTETGLVAVVGATVGGRQALQVKGSDAIGRPAEPDDLEVARRWIDGHARALSVPGWDAASVREGLSAALDDLVAIEFTITETFDQTPGPKAGGRLG